MKREHRVKKRNFKEKIEALLHRYAYIETFVITALYVGIGYFVDNEDPLLLHGQIPYLIILLAVITLFHGMESGVFALTLVTTVMWSVYKPFPHESFLTALLMTMLFSEFYRYWKGKIEHYRLEAEYKTRRFTELARAFYTLKISHEQLEKNYVVKPMSVRSSLEYILQKKQKAIEAKNMSITRHTRDFLELLQKSFSVKEAEALVLDTLTLEASTDIGFFKKHAQLISTSKNPKISPQMIFDEEMVDQALTKKRSIYISDAVGNPSLEAASEDSTLAVIPSFFEERLLGVLVIRRMPFLAFNKENLTSISILLDYFFIELANQGFLSENNLLPYVEDREFAVEFSRLKYIYDKYRVNSATLVFKAKDSLHARRLYEHAAKILRSLDMLTFVKYHNSYSVIVLLVLNDDAAAEGFLHRFENSLPTLQDREFEVMNFDMRSIDDMNEYVKTEYKYVAAK